MKRIVLTAVILVAAGSVIRGATSTEYEHYKGKAEALARQAADSVAANPVPTVLGLGTFLLTVVYHKAKGKSFRESVEAAATRVTVVSVPPPVEADETAVVKRAKARATRTQLLTDQIGLENRLKGLPEAVTKAEKEACYTEQAVSDAKRALGAKHKAHNDAVAKLTALRKEKAAGDAELTAIAGELAKLAERV